MLKLRHLFLAGVALLSLTPLVAGRPAFAGGDTDSERTQLYAKHGWWEIRAYDDGTCFAYANYQFDQRIRIGVVGRNDYYMMLGSPGVEGLKAMDGFPIRAKFDNGETFTGKADVNQAPRLRIMEFPLGGSMMHSIMVANNMEIYALTKQSGWKLVASMNLRGTYAAMLKTAECTAANGGGGTQPATRNPFHSTSAQQ